MSTKRFIYKLWFGFGLILFGIPLFFTFIFTNFGGLVGELPSFESLENPKDDRSSEIYSADGVLLGRYFRSNRSPISFNEIPQSLISALIATEDIRFEKHHGLDFIGIFRAIILSVILRQKKGGGSTLTQQLAKNLFKLRSREKIGLLERIPIIRFAITKAKEWIVSIKLERSYTKKELLTMYLNTSFFGNNAFGIKIAAYTFFGKNTKELSIIEAATLVGLLKAPSFYNPISHPERCLLRRNVVLKNMLNAKFISKADYQNLILKPITLNYNRDDHVTGYATYFRSTIRDYLQ